MIDNQPNLIKTPLSKQGNLILVGGLVMILVTLLIPLPTIAMDTLIAGSISLSIAVLIITLASKEAMELSTFPSLLLFVTLFRLSINVASTRLILLNADAGKVIETFGSFVAGGSLVVGLVIFLILVLIQFIVITKGAERISEVSARFTLDAMPGKQMAIDADLNAGAIDEKQANERRTKIVKESEFYGAMDGASKFIRGDAKAGLIITAINIVGGIAIGYSKGMTISTALKTYSLLSIGDGLVSQIPSIIISLSSGFLVTKISSASNLGQDFSKQFLKSSQPLMITGAVIVMMGLIPGMPIIPFLVLGGLSFGLGQFARTYENNKAAQADQPSQEIAQPEQNPIEDLLDIDKISINVGVRLINMVNPKKNSSIFDRIGAVRRKFAQQLGIVIPLFRLRDNITLDPNSYQIKISDIAVATGRLEPDMVLAMDGGTVQNKIEGIKTTEPVYNLEALWITPAQKEQAELNGYTVIDPESVFITHLSETLKKHASDMLTREDIQMLLERLRKTQPSLVGDIIGEVVSVATLQRVLKNLLSNNIPIRELPTIIESLGEHASKTKNTVVLTELVRKHLSRTITALYKDSDDKITAITLDPVLEHQMTSNLQQQGDELTLAMPAETIMQLNQQIAQSWKSAMDNNFDNIILICDSRLRATLASMLSSTIPMPIVAYDEIVGGTEITPIETIILPEPEQTQDIQSPELATVS